MSPTTTKLLKIAELSGLRPEPRWGAKTAPQTPSSRAAASVARCAAFGVTLLGQKKIHGIFLGTLAPLYHNEKYTVKDHDQFN